MKSLILYLCISCFAPLCVVEHNVIINNYGNNEKVEFEISEVKVIKHYKEKEKYILLFNLSIHNVGNNKISFMYSDLSFNRKDFKEINIQLLPQASLFSSIAPLPMDVLLNNKVKLELYVVIDNLKADYNFMGINLKN